jgi:protein gp37
MGELTGIEWTKRSWNPWQGCAHVSPGCDNCYMFSEKKRYGQNPDIVVRSSPATFNAPYKWDREAARAGELDKVFTCSWSDFFHVTADPWRDEAWNIIESTPNLVYQVLTKRHARIKNHLPLTWGKGWPNVWLGVSGENQEWASRRLDSLQGIPAAVRFLSYEPALGPLDIYEWLEAGFLDWVIIGGESGPGARPFHMEWAADVVQQCRAAGVACFVKQMGSVWAKEHKALHKKGGDMQEWPEALRVREFPTMRILSGAVA